jgi:hypothetical protein
MQSRVRNDCEGLGSSGHRLKHLVGNPGQIVDLRPARLVRLEVASFAGVPDAVANPDVLSVEYIKSNGRCAAGLDWKGKSVEVQL